MNHVGAPAHLPSPFQSLVAILVLVTAATTVEAADRYQMRSAVSARLRAAQRIAAAGAEDTLPMALALPLQHEDELQALLAAQQQPGSPEYHQWLTPAEFTQRFAPPAEEYTAVLDWLRGEGFAVRAWPNRLRVDFSGPVTAVERTFGVRMGQYQYRGHHILANDAAPLLPAELAATVAMLRLDTFPVAEPMLRLTGPGGTIDTMAPHDLYAAYDVLPVLGRGIDGSGQTVAVVARSNFRDSDISTFQADFGVRVRSAIKVVPGNDPGIGATNGFCRNMSPSSVRQQCIMDNEGEVLIDVEWAGVMAPGANVLVDISGEDIDVSLADVIINHPEAKIVTLSFGGCERLNGGALSFVAPLYAQAAAQGQTVLVATGDSGADGCQDGLGPSVNLLSSDANVTAVGGTALNPGFDAQGNATQYVSESVWNDADGAGGGGASILVAKPAYQVAPGVPADGARDQPDVALLASPRNVGYVLIFESQLAVVGGTSAATPAWAGIVALLNDAAGTNGMGALNHSLYALGQRQYADGGLAVFHDVTVGNISFNHVVGASAGPGYDLASGLGTPDVDKLVQAFSPSACAGDCNGDSAVTVDELILGINIALGAADPILCTIMDVDRDGEISIDGLIQAANRALNGC